MPISGLQGGTEYHYRIVATNVYGKTVGEDRTFTTPPAVTALNTGAVTGITNTSAELHGSSKRTASKPTITSNGARRPATVPSLRCRRASPCRPAAAKSTWQR